MPKLTRDDAALSRAQKAILLWLLRNDPRPQKWHDRPSRGAVSDPSEMASSCRSIRRLIERGLVTYRPFNPDSVAWWWKQGGPALTEKGREVAKRLSAWGFPGT